MKLEALILGFVYTARRKAKSCWEGLRRELGLKGLSSFSTTPPGKVGDKRSAWEDLREIFAHRTLCILWNWEEVAGEEVECAEWWHEPRRNTTRHPSAS